MRKGSAAADPSDAQLIPHRHTLLHIARSMSLTRAVELSASHGHSHARSMSLAREFKASQHSKTKERGPSCSCSMNMCAPNTPVATVTPSSRTFAMTRS